MTEIIKLIKKKIRENKKRVKECDNLDERSLISFNSNDDPIRTLERIKFYRLGALEELEELLVNVKELNIKLE